MPRLLGGEPISVIGYRVELVLAEKIVTAIQRGTANTRWRDFVDIANLAAGPYDEATLRSSITTVAAHRDIELHPLSEILTDDAELSQPLWAAWRRKQRLTETPATFSELLDNVITFTDPHIHAAGRQP